VTVNSHWTIRHWIRCPFQCLPAVMCCCFYTFYTNALQTSLVNTILKHHINYAKLLQKKVEMLQPVTFIRARYNCLSSAYHIKDAATMLWSCREGRQPVYCMAVLTGPEDEGDRNFGLMTSKTVQTWYSKQRTMKESSIVSFDLWSSVIRTSSSAIAERALQGGSVMAKSGRLEHYRSTFNHYDVIGH